MWQFPVERRFCARTADNLGQAYGQLQSTLEITFHDPTPGSLVLSIQAKAAVGQWNDLLSARRLREALQDHWLVSLFSNRSLRKWWIPPGQHPTRRTGHKTWPMDLMVPLLQGCHPIGQIQIGK